MVAIEVGRIVTKIMGREAGRKAVITNIIDRNFVEISGPESLTGVKRRRVNINHIEPSEHLIKLTKKKNDDDTIVGLVEKDDNLKEFMSKKLH